MSGRARRWRRCWSRPACWTTPSRSCSRASIAVWRAAIEQTYGRSLTIEQAVSDGAILAYELNGAPLPSQHGYPLRLVVPGWYGMTNVKWLSSITAVSEPFAGYQQAQSYRWRREQHETGRPVTRMMPRALMAPPGIPEFISRERTVAAGEPVLVQGRAWSGWGPIELVEFSDDGGDSWGAAELGDQAQPARLAGLVGQLAAGWGRSLRAVLPRHRRDRRHPAAAPGVEPGRLREQRRPARPGHRQGWLIPRATRRWTGLGHAGRHDRPWPGHHPACPADAPDVQRAPSCAQHPRIPRNQPSIASPVSRSKKCSLRVSTCRVIGCPR